MNLNAPVVPIGSHGAMRRENIHEHHQPRQIEMIGNREIHALWRHQKSLLGSERMIESVHNRRTWRSSAKHSDTTMSGAGENRFDQ